MNGGWLPRDGLNRWLEPLFAISILGFLVYSIWHLTVAYFLPQPFFYISWDVWMDWFNTSYWAHNPGAYDDWRTLYPPISFLFLRFTTLAHCYQPTGAASEGLLGRDCDWLGLTVLHGWFVLNIVLTGKALLAQDRRTALWRAIAVSAGMPMLDGLERANLILVAYTCFLLAHGPLLRSARLRWLFLGLSINFKVYLIPTLFAYLLRRRWRWFEGAAIATALVYLVSWGLLGVGTPMEVVGNLANWSEQISSAGSLLDAWYATAYTGVISLLESSEFPATAVLGSDLVEWGDLLIPNAVRITQLMIVATAAAIWVRSEVVPMYRIVNLCMCLAMITSEPGAYAQCMIMLLTFFERWRGFGAKWAIVVCYILAIPGDIFLSPIYSLQNPGFVNSPPVFREYWITVGPFLRPALVLSIPFALCCVTLKDIWHDIRTQGWKWRHRFRHDLPLMVEGGRPLAAPGGQPA